MKRRHYLGGYKLLLGILGASSIVTEVVVGAQRGILIPANFLSYFTTEANMFAAIVFLITGVMVLKKLNHESVGFIRGASTLYMITTGIVFGVLLSGYDPAVLTFVPWDNIVLHYIIPVGVLIDWIVDPPRQRITVKSALLWLLYPMGYLIYTLSRGPIAQWYPYPFLDPANEDGLVGVVITALGITVLMLIVTVCLVKFAGTPKKV